MAKAKASAKRIKGDKPATIPPEGIPNPLLAMSPQQMAAAIAQLVPVGGFTTNASLFVIQWDGNDVVMMFGRPQPLTLAGTQVQPVGSRHEYTAIIHMSGATLKDLKVAIDAKVEEYEKEHGEIQTLYTRRIAAAKIRPKK